jgi:hypothetical protein
LTKVRSVGSGEKLGSMLGFTREHAP